MIVELLARAADLSLEKATVRTMGRLEALTEIAVPAWTGLDRGLCTTWSTGIIRSRSRMRWTRTSPPPTATQPSTLPPPNPELEVAR